MSYSFWFNLGSLLASIVLTVRAYSNPFDYKTSIYIQFGMIGISCIIFAFLPESPCESRQPLPQLPYAARVPCIDHAHVQGGKSAAAEWTKPARF